MVGMSRHPFGSAPFFGCTLPCCEPNARREVVEWSVPLPLACRIAFCMGASNASVPRLSADCAPSMLRLPLAVLQLIFRFCAGTDRRLVASSVPPPPPPNKKPFARHEMRGFGGGRDDPDFDMPGLCDMTI